MFGRFLELAIATQDILRSVQFYERLGFTQQPAGDAWRHRYAVLSDGRIALGLHERALSSPAPSFVLPELALARARLTAQGIAPEHTELREDSLHYLLLRDPGNHAVVLQEARSFSPSAPTTPTPCGYFLHLSLPQGDFVQARTFWEAAGLIALPSAEQPYEHLPLTGDQFELAFHRRAACAQPLLVFDSSDLRATIRVLHERGLSASPRRLTGLGLPEHLLLEAPEGTLLVIVNGDAP